MTETVDQQILLFTFALIFSILNSIIAYRLGFFIKLSKEEKPSLYFKEVAWVFVIFLGIQILVVPFLTQIWLWIANGTMVSLSNVNQKVLSWMNVSSIFLSLVALIAYYQFFDPRTKKIIWGNSNQPLKSFFVGVIAWPICYPIVTALGNLIGLFIIALFQSEPVDQTAVKYLKTSMANPYFFWTLIAVVVLIVPILEEILFRGYLQTWLKNFFEPKGAIILASMIFSLFHFSIEQGLQNFELLTALFVMSCFLGYLYERQKSLWAPIGLHMVFNMVSVFVLIWEQS